MLAGQIIPGWFYIAMPLIAIIGIVVASICSWLGRRSNKVILEPNHLYDIIGYTKDKITKHETIIELRNKGIEIAKPRIRFNSKASVTPLGVSFSANNLAVSLFENDMALKFGQELVLNSLPRNARLLMAVERPLTQISAFGEKISCDSLWIVVESDGAEVTKELKVSLKQPRICDSVVYESVA